MQKNAIKDGGSTTMHSKAKGGKKDGLDLKTFFFFGFRQFLENFQKVVNSREFLRNFTSRSRSWSFFISLSLLDFDFQSFLLFHFHSSISISSKKNSLALLEESKWHFFSLHLSLLYCPKPTLTGHWTLVMLEQYVLQHHGICKNLLIFHALDDWHIFCCI